MAKLVTNVYIHPSDDQPGGWFGPDYPDQPTEAQLASVAGNPALFEVDADPAQSELERQLAQAEANARASAEPDAEAEGKSEKRGK